MRLLKDLSSKKSIGPFMAQPRLEHSACARLLPPCGHLGQYMQDAMPLGLSLRVRKFIVAGVF